jgi:type I restriction enzyme, S subunit
MNFISFHADVSYTAINRIPVSTNQGFKSFVASKAYPVEFIYYTLHHLMRVTDQNATGSTFKEVSASTLKTISTVLPDAAVLQAYQKTVSPLFRQQDNLEQQNQEISRLRDWLLPMLMNGQVRMGES